MNVLSSAPVISHSFLLTETDKFDAFLSGGKGHRDCPGQPYWLWICYWQRGEQGFYAQLSFIMFIMSSHLTPSMFRAAYSMAEKPCATSWIKVKSRRFRNLLLKKSSSCKTSRSQSFVLAELFSNFRLRSNSSWCCESPWQILWQREGGQGRRAFTFSRW